MLLLLRLLPEQNQFHWQQQQVHCCDWSTPLQLPLQLVLSWSLLHGDPYTRLLSMGEQQKQQHQQ
jgi:hypothetical protein